MKCQICGGQVEPRVHCGDYTYFVCATCRTSQVLPQPSREDLCEYYAQYHMSAADGGTYVQFEERMRADFPAKVQHVRKTLSRRKEQTEDPWRLLDVGCGKGFFLGVAGLRGFETEGVDVSETAVKYGREELGMSVQAGILDEMDVPQWQGHFDVVTLWATIEHVQRPLSLLKAIHGVLKPGGYVFLDTGLGDEFWERLLPGHSQWYDALQHLFVFSEEGLSILLEEAGFTILQVDRNWERSYLRRYAKLLRHAYLCIGSFCLVRPVLQRGEVVNWKSEVKWPTGRLLSAVAKK